MSGEQTFRLRITSPSQYAGWITERVHLVRPVGVGLSGVPTAGVATGATSLAGGGRGQGVASTGSTPTSYLDPEITSELARRAQIRHVRHERQALRHTQAVAHRRATVQGTLDTSSETFFLLNGERKQPYGSSSSSSSSSSSGNPMLSSDFTSVSYPASGANYLSIYLSIHSRIQPRYYYMLLLYDYLLPSSSHSCPLIPPLPSLPLASPHSSLSLTLPPPLPSSLTFALLLPSPLLPPPPLPLLQVGVVAAVSPSAHEDSLAECTTGKYKSMEHRGEECLSG